MNSDPPPVPGDDQQGLPALDALADSSEWDALAEGSSTAELPAAEEVLADRAGHPRESASLLDELLAEAEHDLGRSPATRQPEHRAAKPRSTNEDGERYLLFSLAGRDYAIPAGGVAEVSQLLRISRVPNLPEWLLGLANVRGDIVSVVDLRAFLGLGACEGTAQTRMVLVRSSPGDLTTILLVDRVRSIRRLSLGPNTSHAVADPRITPLVTGVCEYAGALLIALDLERLLQSAELRELESV